MSREQEVPTAVLEVVREQTAIYLARADRQEAKIDQAVEAAKDAVKAVTTLQNEALPGLVQVCGPIVFAVHAFGHTPPDCRPSVE